MPGVQTLARAFVLALLATTASANANSNANANVHLNADANANENENANVNAKSDSNAVEIDFQRLQDGSQGRVVVSDKRVKVNIKDVETASFISQLERIQLHSYDYVSDHFRRYVSC